MMYVFPKLSEHNYSFFRFSGGGLGNLLFPYARAILFAEKYGHRLINPTWTGIKIGPIIRGEKDKRFYGDLFNPVPGSINGHKKYFLLATKKWIPEFSIKKEALDKGNNGIFTFEGLGDYFDDILYDHEFVRSALIGIIRAEHLNGLNYDFDRSVSLHIRLGDFKVGNQVTDLTWFIRVVREIRNFCGQDLAVNIFSDGTDQELEELLKIENTRRVCFGSSIADMIALSKSKILVCSKNSTFSWWASYMGRMPVIWPKDTNTRPVYYEKPEFERYIDYEEKLGKEFLQIIKI